MKPVTHESHKSYKNDFPIHLDEKYHMGIICKSQIGANICKLVEQRAKEGTKRKLKWLFGRVSLKSALGGLSSLWHTHT